MNMDRFSTELEYNFCFLNDARSILMTSFFSHKTISYLDLQVIESDLYSRRLPIPLRMLLADFLMEKTFFCTEESLRNSLVPKRRLLYTLNLDVPDGREYSNQRNGCVLMNLPTHEDSLFVAVVGYSNPDYFYKRALVRCVELAWKQTDCKIKFLKWMQDFRPLESLPLDFEHDFQKSFAMILYRERVDPEFTLTFFVKFLGFHAFLRKGELEVLEHLLYSARLRDFNFKIHKFCYSSLTDYCIKYLGFAFVQSFLKYEDTTYYTEYYYSVYKSVIFLNMREELRVEELRMPETQMSKERLFRILQIIYISDYPRLCLIFGEFFRKVYASEALRCIWSSIPDCFVSLQEMSNTYRHVLPSQVIIQAHSFYEDAIGQTVSRREPRTLTHYCRSVIRRSLYDAKHWLPEGIKQLKLPPRFEDFLNLQRDNLRPEHF